MGGSELIGIKTGEIGAWGSEFRASADAVRNVEKPVRDNLFGGGDEAGQGYTSDGAKVHTALERVTKWLQNWSEATMMVSDAVGASVVNITYTDKQNTYDITAAGTQK
ncbi:hypothetical protein [Nocardia cyriacigeorgica]|uniref:hypothetical protein n=1 Tax=Nocardia cyriacigeorgica TaxID=135487 RepID=UPI001894E7F1|nr:hypothetical protein [Nocardia cyriacigeorgica]MBF6425648.1 hypothetical protein [Nocardia cyriacigeorgica]BDT85144.1 hypothetical protein FMUAM8_09080 [Nocardia cyriacigeorgica]